MFKAIIRAEHIQDTLDTVNALVDECRIHLNEDGLEIRAVDPANVGMVDLSLDVEAFESYQADGGLIGVNSSRFEDVDGMADRDQLVYLELDEATRKLHVDIDGQRRYLHVRHRDVHFELCDQLVLVEFGMAGFVLPGPAVPGFPVDNQPLLVVFLFHVESSIAA